MNKPLFVVIIFCFSILSGCGENRTTSTKASVLFTQFSLDSFLDQNKLYFGTPKVLENGHTFALDAGVAQGLISIQFEGIEAREGLLDSLRDYLTQYVKENGGEAFPGVISGELPRTVHFSYSVKNRTGRIKSSLYKNLLIVNRVEFDK